MPSGSTPRGVIAAGHKETVHAAKIILQQEGNAFDAALAALVCACVVEPILASLGGGGYLLARTGDGRPRVYDFFVQTPQQRRPDAELDFFPISADFGTAQQEFHIGKGSVAVPGVVRGIFEVHRELGTLPMRDIVAPAISYAKKGVSVNEFQAYIFSIVGDICIATPGAAAIYGRYREATHPGPQGFQAQTPKLCNTQNKIYPVAQGEILKQPVLADTLESLAIEGDDLFYRGEIAKAIVRDMQDGGGHLTALDLAQYRLERRKPLQFTYRGEQLFTNPPPSSGGILIAFALKLLETVTFGQQTDTFDSMERLTQLARVMDLTSQARIEAGLSEETHHLNPRLLDAEYLATYRDRIMHAPRASRGTTHISIIDRDGNVASLSLSNGEGAGYVVPNTGIMLNNMLGEQDINPHGFHRWPTAHRMTSMMAPTMIERPTNNRGTKHPGDHIIATGSGGSNRIRSAILQVLINIIDFKMDIEAAVRSPRIHHEDELLSIEGGFDEENIARLLALFPNHHLWPGRNLFFGGTHTVLRNGDQFQGAGDARRGGISLVV
uniref:Gamma-glutamyltranspeptidase / glutathione hydrolase n=1 Tax=Candidatus Kentrum sp. TUN TaxID=2126343 RepID=A0A450ZEC3_9GAMM|nr:MAG: gamma-glutamyltranspeptidase / glutathione hydrolase [Candidatus Kentron sp. TUN]VFK52695.1 MAG: gamma-glutamyltranspeptidase / glutathione hydrolase [Candidatus Kentron sp. TUN]VFK53265.1 MAG: gamma-glutamyltranspeptidase / glutathione hydrolase [Candidatus Kentron sp. TUN]